MQKIKLANFEKNGEESVTDTRITATGEIDVSDALIICDDIFVCGLQVILIHIKSPHGGIFK